jgi:hypothetical protein
MAMRGSVAVPRRTANTVDSHVLKNTRIAQAEAPRRRSSFVVRRSSFIVHHPL